MDIGLAVALAITLIIAIWLVVKNDLPNEQTQFEKNMDSVVFEDENIKNTDDLKLRISRLQLQEYEDAILSQALPDIRFDFIPLAEEDIPVGSSKIGGFPDMESKMAEDLHTLFFAQINCSECKHEYLPDKGMLYFCLNAEKALQGAPDMVQCVYVAQQEKMVRNAYMNQPLFNACSIHFFDALSLPEYDSEWTANTFTDYRKSAYFKLCNVNQCSKMFGYPMGISSVPDTENGNKTLLLQLDSDASKNMMWGENGRLYVWIDTEKLKKGDFSQVSACIEDYKE